MASDEPKPTPEEPKGEPPSAPGTPSAPEPRSPSGPDASDAVSASREFRAAAEDLKAQSGPETRASLETPRVETGRAPAPKDPTPPVAETKRTDPPAHHRFGVPSHPSHAAPTPAAPSPAAAETGPPAASPHADPAHAHHHSDRMQALAHAHAQVQAARRPIFGWGRFRAAVVIAVLLFLLLRVVLALVVDYAVDRATRGTLGLACKVGSSTLNLSAGQAILSDVALVGSSGTTIARIGRAELDLAWTSLPDLIVERLAVEDVVVDLTRDAAGAIPALAGLGQGTPTKAASAPSPAPGTKAAAPASALPRVLLQRMRINHIVVHWEDQTVSPAFKGELLLDARGDEIASFARPKPPSFSLRLAAPGVLDTFRLDVAGSTTEDGVNAFDMVLAAAAHPTALAPYFGKGIEVSARTLSVSAEARANARPTYLEQGKFYTGDFTLERFSIRADDDEIDFGRIVAVFPRMAKDGLRISSISIDRPKLKLGRLQDGALRVLGFGLKPTAKGAAAAPAAAPPPSDAAPAASGPGLLPAVSIEEIALHGGRMQFTDEGTKPASRIEAELEGSITGIELDPDAPGRRAQIKGTGALPGIAERLSLTGSFVPVGDSREVALDFAADEIGLGALTPYLRSAGFEPGLKHGRARASLFARAVAGASGSLGFSAEISKASYTTGSDEAATELLGLRSFRVENGVLGGDGSVSIGRVVVEGPHFLARRLKGGALAVAGIKTTPVEPSTGPPPAAAPEDAGSSEDGEGDETAPAAPAKQGRVTVEEVVVTGASLAFQDDMLQKPATVALDEGSLDLAGLKLGTDKPVAASLRASAKLAPTIGSVSLEGTLVPDPGAPEVSGTLTARDVNLKPLVGYLQPLGMDTFLERGRVEGGLFAKARFKGAAVADAHLLLSKLALENGTNELGGIDAIELRNMSIDPASHTTNLGDLTITNLRARAFRDAQGQIAFLGLRLKPKAPAAETAEPAPGPKAAAPPPPAAKRRSPSILKMGEVALRGAAFTWHDEQVQPAADVRLSRLDLTMGPRRLDEDPRPGDPPVPLKVHAEIDGVSTLDVDAGLVLSSRAPTYDLDFHMKDVTLKAVAPYLATSGYVPVLQGGTLDGHLAAALSLDPSVLGCRVELSKLAMRDGAKELLGLDRAQVPFDLDDVAHTFHLGNVTVSGPRVVASRTKEGELVYVGLRTKRPDAVAPVATATVAPAAPAGKAPPPLAVNMDSLKIDGMSVDWKDCQSGNAKLELRDGTVECGRYRPGFKSVTPWKVRADLQNLGLLDLSGTAVIQTRTTVEADLRLTRMNGRDISPYLGEGTTLDLDQGSFATKIAYWAEPAPAGGQKLSFTSTALSLEEKGVVHFGWDELKAQLARNDAAAQVYLVDALELSGLQGELSKLPEGVSRSFGLTQRPLPPRPAKEAPPAKPGAAASTEAPPLPTVALGKFVVLGSRLTYHDRSAKNAPEPPPYDLTDFRFESTQPFTLQSEDPTTAILDLSMSLAIPGVCEKAKATLHAIPFDAEPTFRLELGFEGMNGAEMHKRSPGLAEKYDLNRWQGATAHAVMNFTVKSHGRIDQLGSSPAPLAFELDMDSFEVRSTPTSPLCFGLDDFRMDVTSYDTKTGAMHVKKLELTNPTLPMAKEEGGTRYLDVLFKNPPPPPPGSKPPEPAPPGPPPALQTYDRIVLTDGELVWLDETVSPPVDFHMSQWEIDIQGYTNQWKTQKKPMKISMRSRAGTYEDFKVKGQLALAPRLEGDLQIRVLQLKLDKITGWARRDYATDLKGGKFDLEGPWSFHESHAKGAPTVVLFQPEADGVADQPEGLGAKLKTALPHLLDDEDKLELRDVPMEFDLDENLKIVAPIDPATGQPRAANWGIGSILSQALGGALKGAIASILPGSKPKPVQSQSAAERAKAPVLFAPVEMRIPAASIPELERIAADLKSNPLAYVALRGEIGRADDSKARVLASPSIGDRRDLIARLEADRASLERRRADAAAEVRSGLQAGTSDLGVGRAHLTDVSAELKKVDKALESLYEQEREGAERGADRRAREFETELCDNRVEAIAAYLILHGAPPERVKRRPAKLKPIEEIEGRVAIETYVARRKSADRTAVEQKPQAPEGKSPEGKSPEGK